MTVDPNSALKSKYQWLYGRPRFSVLHYVPDVTEWTDDTLGKMMSGTYVARAACGAEMAWDAPGVFSRMHLRRCGHCCRRVGITPGYGAACNDKSASLDPWEPEDE